MNIQQCWNSSTEIPGASPTKATEEAGECWFSVLLRYFCCFCAQSHTAFVSVSSPLWLTSEESSEPFYIFPLSRISATYLFFTVDFLRFIFLQCILGCVFGFQLLCKYLGISAFVCLFVSVFILVEADGCILPYHLPVRNGKKDRLCWMPDRVAFGQAAPEMCIWCFRAMCRLEVVAVAWITSWSPDVQVGVSDGWCGQEWCGWGGADRETGGVWVDFGHEVNLRVGNAAGIGN